MKKNNIILDKSFDFAIQIVNLYKYLCKNREFILSKQLLRSGTSIGANITEAQASQSTNDFISKLSIASKEARETKYWIELLIATNYLNYEDENTKLIINDINEIIKIITSIIKTTQEKRNAK